MPGNPKKKFVVVILIVNACLLASCATQGPEVKNMPPATEKPKQPETLEERTYDSLPPSSYKDGRELKLVRIMEGGACNERDEGVRGYFLVYAQPEQFDRANKGDGEKASERFENELTTLALDALQGAIDTINIADNPFALDIQDNVDQIIDQLIAKFSEFVQPGIEQFESDYKIAIDVIPFAGSMNFILDKCDKGLHEDPISSRGIEYWPQIRTERLAR